MDLLRINFSPIADGGDDVTTALRKSDLNFRTLNMALAPGGEVAERLSTLESTAAQLGNAARKDVGTTVGTVAAGDDSRLRPVGVTAGSVAAGDDPRFASLASAAAAAQSKANSSIQSSGGTITGQLAIGTTSTPAGTLDVRTGAGSYLFRTFATGPNDEPVIDAANNVNSAFSSFNVGGSMFGYLCRAGDGRFLLRMNPVMSLDSVNGANSAFKPMQFTATAFTFNGGNVQVNGNIAASGSITPSDALLKKNIASRSVNRGMALALADAFSEWDLIDGERHQAGVVAQQAQNICPFWVSEIDYTPPPMFQEGSTEFSGKSSVKRLAVDMTGMALESSMDNALSIEELRAELRAAVVRIVALESMVDGRS